MAVDKSVAGVAALAVTQSVELYRGFLPPLRDVRRATDAETAADVRLGEIAAGTLSLGIGLVVSSLIGSALPFVVALVFALALTALYECALSIQPERTALS